MEFFKVPCPDRGEVFIDDSFLGENKNNGELNVFQCNAGNHNISMKCLVGKNCQSLVKLIDIINTNPIHPMEVRFICAL